MSCNSCSNVTLPGVVGPAGPVGPKGDPGDNGLGFTGGSYDSGTGIVTFTSDDGLGFSTTDLRGAKWGCFASFIRGSNFFKRNIKYILYHSIARSKCLECS